jgi:hypothetical protein
MMAVMFVALNLADAYLTKKSLSIGAMEFNPMMLYSGSSLIIKGLLSAALVFVLYSFGREKVLFPLNFLLSGLILWNAAVYCILTFDPF